MKISVPSHDPEYNHKPFIGEHPHLCVPPEWSADTDDPATVLALIDRMNNIIIDQLHLLYKMDLVYHNRGALTEIHALYERRDKYHLG